MSLARLAMLALAALALVGTATCTPAGDELATCIEGRWKVAPGPPGKASATIEGLGQSLVVYEIRPSMLVVATSTGEVIEEKRFTLEPKDRRHGWLDTESGGPIEVSADDGCGKLVLVSEGSQFELRRASE